MVGSLTKLPRDIASDSLEPSWSVLELNPSVDVQKEFSSLFD